MNEATCISCGAPYGQPHYSNCKFTLLLALLAFGKEWAQ